MILLVGLGNPGEQYESTRHNAGWLFLDYLKDLPEADFENWKEKKKLNAFISEGFLHLSLRGHPKQSHSERTNEIATLPSVARDDKVRIVLAKPTTFMNNSGVAVKKLTTSYKLQATSSLIVAHDDMDIPFGEFKIQTNRGPAGHHGVESIISYLGTRNFTRIRVGISPIKKFDERIKTTRANDHVLKRFSKTELKELEGVFDDILRRLKTTIPTN